MNQILTQDEINALLKGLSDGDVPTDAQGAAAQAIPASARNYDLASQERIIRGRMPTMELIHDRFARSFRNVLGKFLGRTCFVNIGGIEIIKFGLFQKKLPLPSSLHVFRMPPLHGFALMVVSTSLVYGIVDNLFGGKGSGKVKIEGREYTAIETRLITKVVLMALEVLRESWAPIHPIDFVYVRSEFNPIAAAIVPPTDMVIVVTIEVELEQESTTLTLCIPYSGIEPIRQKLTTGLQSTRLEQDTNVLKRMENGIRQSPVNVSVNLARGTIRAREAAGLKIGDIIPLETSPTEEAIVYVEGIPKLKGYVGTYRGSRAVRVSSAFATRAKSKG